MAEHYDWFSAAADAALLLLALSGLWFFVRAVMRLAAKPTRALGIATVILGSVAAVIASFVGGFAEGITLPAALQTWLWPLAGFGAASLVLFGIERRGDVRRSGTGDVARGALRAFAIVAFVATLPGLLITAMALYVAIEDPKGALMMLPFPVIITAVPAAIGFVLWRLARKRNGATIAI